MAGKQELEPAVCSVCDHLLSLHHNYGWYLVLPLIPSSGSGLLTLG